MKKETESRFGENHPVCSKAASTKAVCIKQPPTAASTQCSAPLLQKVAFDNFLTYGFFRENNSRSTNLLCSNF